MRDQTHVSLGALMRLIHAGRILILSTLVLNFNVSKSVAEGPGSQRSEAGEWPQKVVVTVGGIRTRIDGPKLWTLSGIDFQDSVLATENSAYGSVLTIRNVGHLGTAHFLDVPGKPGQVEKEQVTSLQLFVDEKSVSEFTPTMALAGGSFRMERKSTIRTMHLESSVVLQDEILTETVHFHATAPLDLQNTYPWMYAFTHKATAYLFTDKTGVQQRGTFRAEGKPGSRVFQNADWMAVFDPSSGKGAVCCLLKHPPMAEGSLLLVDAPGSYRKVAAYSLVDKIVPKGFEGTYKSAVGFFKATEGDWEQHAIRRADEIKAVITER